jgi:hypothetical protein
MGHDDAERDRLTGIPRVRGRVRGALFRRHVLPRLVAGAGGSIQAQIGYDGFFWLSGGLSAAAILFLPFIVNVQPRPADA